MKRIVGANLVFAHHKLGLPVVFLPWERPGAEGYHFAGFLEGVFSMTVTKALFVTLEAKPGKEKEMEQFLNGGAPIVQEEPATIAWFAIKMGPSKFGIFDAFPDEAGRQAHLSGRVAAALMAKAPELLAKAPSIEKVDVLAAKLPG
jgi:quinol monooxygenase YgiN